MLPSPVFYRMPFCVLIMTIFAPVREITNTEESVCTRCQEVLEVLEEKYGIPFHRPYCCKQEFLFGMLLSESPHTTDSYLTLLEECVLFLTTKSATGARNKDWHQIYQRQENITAFEHCVSKDCNTLDWTLERIQSLALSPNHTPNISVIRSVLRQSPVQMMASIRMMSTKNIIDRDTLGTLSGQAYALESKWPQANIADILKELIPRVMTFEGSDRRNFVGQDILFPEWIYSEWGRIRFWGCKQNRDRAMKAITKMIYQLFSVVRHVIFDAHNSEIERAKIRWTVECVNHSPLTHTPLIMLACKQNRAQIQATHATYHLSNQLIPQKLYGSTGIATRSNPHERTQKPSIINNFQADDPQLELKKAQKLTEQVLELDDLDLATALRELIKKRPALVQLIERDRTRQVDTLVEFPLPEEVPQPAKLLLEIKQGRL